MTVTADDLTALHALVGASWAAGGVPRDSGNRPVDPLDPAATQWDLISACVKVTTADTTRMRAMVTAMRDQSPSGIACFDLAPGRNRGQLQALIAAAAAAS